MNEAMHQHMIINHHTAHTIRRTILIAGLGNKYLGTNCHFLLKNRPDHACTLKPEWLKRLVPFRTLVCSPQIAGFSFKIAMAGGSVIVFKTKPAGNNFSQWTRIFNFLIAICYIPVR